MYRPFRPAKPKDEYLTLACWKGYLDTIFDVHVSKADVLSHFRTGAYTLDKYAFGMKEPWPGDVLVLGGENDPVSSDADRRGILEYYPNISLNIIRGSGHTVAMEKPDEYLANIIAFFDGGRENLLDPKGDCIRYVGYGGWARWDRNRKYIHPQTA